MSYVRRSRRDSIARAVAIPATCLLLACSPNVGQAKEELAPISLSQHCGPRGTTGGVPPGDYRQRNVDPYVKKQISNLEFYHLSKARKSLGAKHAPSVMSNLDFALRHVPNHYEALQMLIGWELRGGGLGGYRKSNCYLDWAREFVPDDEMVLAMGGTYFWKKGQVPMADAWYRKAVEVAPASAEANYAYGLMLFDQKQYDEARQRATAAYAAGYPLPGLRDKLRKAGYPLDTLAAR
jgi:tetratricopeptide (TPR) repeat protein